MSFRKVTFKSVEDDMTCPDCNTKMYIVLDYEPPIYKCPNCRLEIEKENKT